MTNQEATLLLGRLVLAYPTTKVSEATAALYLEYLRPLPAQWTERAVAELILTHRYSALPTIADVMHAAGVADDDTRTQLLDAKRRSLPLVRDAASVTGWAVGEALYPPEALPVATPALMGPPVGVEKRKGVIEMVKALAGRAGGMSWS